MDVDNTISVIYILEAFSELKLAAVLTVYVLEVDAPNAFRVIHLADNVYVVIELDPLLVDNSIVGLAVGCDVPGLEVCLSVILCIPRCKRPDALCADIVNKGASITVCIGVLNYELNVQSI